METIRIQGKYTNFSNNENLKKNDFQKFKKKTFIYLIFLKIFFGKFLSCALFWILILFKSPLEKNLFKKVIKLLKS